MPDGLSPPLDTSPPSPRRVPWQFIAVLIALGLSGLAVVWVCFGFGSQISLPPGVSNRERELARKTFRIQRGREAKRDDLLFVLAESYMSAERRLNDAVACLAEIPTSHPEYGRMARYQQGRTLLALHRATEAELQARELIALEESEPQISPELLINLRQGLRHILEVELRFEERHELLKGVIARKEATGFEIFAGCFPSHLPWNGSHALRWIEEFHQADPTDPLIRIALGRYLTGRGELKAARKILEDVAREYPQDLRATAALIACLRETDAPEEVDRRMTALPVQSPHDPWLLLLQRGIYALEQGRGQDAAMAYEQVLQQDRTSNQAWQGLARAAQLLGDAPRREHAIKMGTGLARILNKLAKGMERESDPNSYLDIADLCAEIGLDHEGFILTNFASKLEPHNPRVLKTLKKFPTPQHPETPEIKQTTKNQ